MQNYIFFFIQIQKKKKKKSIKEQFTSKLCPTIFNGIKIAIQKCENKILNTPICISTHT